MAQISFVTRHSPPAVMNMSRHPLSPRRSRESFAHWSTDKYNLAHVPNTLVPTPAPLAGPKCVRTVHQKIIRAAGRTRTAGFQTRHDPGRDKSEGAPNCFRTPRSFWCLEDDY